MPHIEVLDDRQKSTAIDSAQPCESSLTRDFAFIIGAPRSGSTWLQAMIGAHPHVATTVELTLFSRYLKPWFDAYQQEKFHIDNGDWHQGLPVVWSESDLEGFARQFLELVYRRVLERTPEASCILDKQPDYSHHVGLIKRLMPRAKFIHLIRDGRDVTSSMLAASRDMGFGARTMVDAAREWKRYVTDALSASGSQHDYLEVRYEDLLHNTTAVLQGIFEFLGVEVHEGLLATLVDTHRFETQKAARSSADPTIKAPAAHFRKGKAGTWADDLTPAQLHTFDAIAGSLLVELGYAAQGWYRPRLTTRIVAALQRVQRRLLN